MATITAIKDSINRLDPAGFQILCDDYLSREGYPNLVSLGTMAGAQKTTPGTPDTYFPIESDKYIFAEYTTIEEKNLVQKIKSDINKCFDEGKTKIPVKSISEIVYCHTSSNLSPEDDRELKEYCAKKGVLLTLIGIDRLADDLRWKYPILAKEHLGLPIDTEQVHTVEDYIQRYDSNTLAAPLETTFLGREKELALLKKHFATYNVVIVTGAAGVGKTRLSIEFAKMHASGNGEAVYCIRSRALGLINDLNMYFCRPGSFFIVVDDANQITDLNLIIDLVKSKKEGFSFNLLLTVRDYAIEKVRKTLSNVIPYKEVNLGKFKDDEIKTLMTNQFGILNPHYLDRIVALSEGNARIAMIAGKLSADANRLDVINDATELFNEYYSPVLCDSGLETDTALLSTAGVAAYLGALHVDHIDPVLPILAAIGVDKETFIENLLRLSRLEIIDIYHDKAVRFSEQCFANYILKYVFFDKKVLPLSEMIEACFSQYKERTVFAVNTLNNVFRSEHVHEFVRQEVIAVWNKLKENASELFWPFLRTFYPINPVEALLEVKGVIDNAAPVIISADEMDTEKGKNYQSVNDEVLSILCGYADTQDLEAALDLFFQYYLKRPDNFMQFYHAATIYYNIHPNSYMYGFRTQQLFFSKLYEYSAEWTNEHVLILFLNVVNEFLQFEFRHHESTRDGKGLSICHFSLQPSDCVTAYRSLIWAGLEQIARLGNYHNQLARVFEHYGQGISECSIGVLQEDAPLLVGVIQAGFSPECLEDCKIAEHIAECFDRHNISTEALQPFLNSPCIKTFRILKGPRFTHEYNYEKWQSVHKEWIREFLFAGPSPVEAFSQLYDVYMATKGQNYEATTGIWFALQLLAEDKDAYIEAVRYALSVGEGEGIDACYAVQTLFSILPVSSVFEFIERNASAPITLNRWMYAFYHEMPEIAIDDQQVEGLYRFLQDDSDAVINSSGPRDISFLQKYAAADNSVIIKACNIILEKRSYSQFMARIYLEQLCNPYIQQGPDIFEMLHGHIDLVEQIYLFLLQLGANHDHEGSILVKIAREDSCFHQSLARDLLRRVEAHELYDIDTRYSALYSMDHYLEFIDGVVEIAISSAKYPTWFVPRIIKQFLILPEKRSDLEAKKMSWLHHYIAAYSQNEIKMRCLFDALSDLSIDLRRDCIEWFVKENHSFEMFKNLSILPSSWGGFGSLIPIYKGWIDYLNSLLPFFHGIEYISHKKYILDKIDSVQAMIQQEEISEFIEG